jgi:hypothetical protein
MASPILHRFPAFVVTLAVVAAASCFTACGLLREDACVSPGDSCAVNSDCCAGLGCILGSCSSPGGSTFGSNEPAAGSGSTSSGGACAQPGDLCNPTPCCDPELPDGGGANVCYFGLVCQACTTAGGVCEFDSDCCAGMTCSNSACTAPSTSKSSGGTSSGSSSSGSGSGSRGSSSSSGGVCAAYGASCQSTPCCEGLACDGATYDCYVGESSPCSGAENICANGNTCYDGVCLACGKSYGADCSGSGCCTSGLACDANFNVCFNSVGGPCSNYQTPNCAAPEVCTPAGVCGPPAPCANYGETGCNAGGCCSFDLTCVASSDTCLIGDSFPCDNGGPETQCADGAACPAVSGLCGVTTGCAGGYNAECTLQGCCAGFTCDTEFCWVADGQPCSFDGGTVIERCAAPDACDPATGLCACVAQGASCTPLDLGGVPCCSGSCQTNINTNAWECLPGN